VAVRVALQRQPCLVSGGVQFSKSSKFRSSEAASGAIDELNANQVGTSRRKPGGRWDALCVEPPEELTQRWLGVIRRSHYRKGKVTMNGTQLKPRRQKIRKFHLKVRDDANLMLVLAPGSAMTSASFSPYKCLVQENQDQLPLEPSLRPGQKPQSPAMSGLENWSFCPQERIVGVDV
jgi:hypothetical protein